MKNISQVIKHNSSFSSIFNINCFSPLTYISFQTIITIYFSLCIMNCESDVTIFRAYKLHSPEIKHFGEEEMKTSDKMNDSNGEMCCSSQSLKCLKNKAIWWIIGLSIFTEFSHISPAKMAGFENHIPSTCKFTIFTLNRDSNRAPKAFSYVCTVKAHRPTQGLMPMFED